MNCFISAAPYVVRTPTPSPKRLWGHGSRDLCQAGRLPPLCLLRTGKSLCTLIVWKIQTQRSSVEGNGLMTGPTWSMKVGRRSEARSAGACTGLSSDLRPVPRRREGEREKRRGGRLLSREVWRAAQGDPDMEAAAGMQPPWPRPPRARTGRDPGLLLQPVPATLLPAPKPQPPPGILPSPPPPRAPRIPGSPAAPQPPARAAEFPLPRILTPSPPPQPDPRALPRILGPRGPCPAPTPASGGPGAGEGAQARARPRLPRPIVPRRPSRALRATPREPWRPQLTALGSGRGRKAESSPRGLNPLNALPWGAG